MMRSAAVVVVLTCIALTAPGCRRRPRPRQPNDFGAVGNSWGRRGAARRSVPARRPGDAEVIDVRVGDASTPVVAGRFRWGGRTITFISAPEHSPEWVTVGIQSTTGLRGCDQMRLEHGSGFETAPLESFDRSGTNVRYEVPFDGLVRAAGSSAVTLAACGQRWALEGAKLAEFRRMVLLAIYRRARAAPALSLPGPDAPPSGDEPSEPLRARLPLRRSVDVTMVFDEARAEQVELRFAAQQPDAFASCEVHFEAGPATVRATHRSTSEDGREMTWTVEDMRSFFALGVVDRASLHVCGSTVDLARYAGGLRRFIVLTLMRSAASRVPAPSVDLPPGSRSDESFALPEARGSATSGDVVDPAEERPTDPPAAEESADELREPGESADRPL